MSSAEAVEFVHARMSSTGVSDVNTLEVAPPRAWQQRRHNRCERSCGRRRQAQIGSNDRSIIKTAMQRGNGNGPLPHREAATRGTADRTVRCRPVSASGTGRPGAASSACKRPQHCAVPIELRPNASRLESRTIRLPWPRSLASRGCAEGQAASLSNTGPSCAIG